MRKIFIGMLSFFAATDAEAQSEQELNEAKDSVYIHEIEDKTEPDKVLHAEPLYIDLIRDLGARKGEREWNVGDGLTDNNQYDKYTALVEYEWAPVNRLGLEVEMPFSFYYPTAENSETPKSKLNSFKVAAQYSFFVSERHSTSMAVGYIQEFEMNEFAHYSSDRLFTGNIYNPFFVAAKRWGSNFHTLLYTGPAVAQHFGYTGTHTSWQINSNIHYMIPGTRNFIGVEFNKTIEHGDFDMTVRPQMRVSIADNLLVGIVAGIPIKRENERFSTFLRLIYEPGHRSK